MKFSRRQCRRGVKWNHRLIGRCDFHNCKRCIEYDCTITHRSTADFLIQTCRKHANAKNCKTILNRFTQGEA